MINSSTKKKRVVASFSNLTNDLQEQVKQKYPTGFNDSMIRIDKPDGTFFYAVSYDTNDISYLVKINVKIDNASQDDDEKDFYEDDIKGADEIAPNSGDDDDDDM